LYCSTANFHKNDPAIPTELQNKIKLLSPIFTQNHLNYKHHSWVVSLDVESGTITEPLVVKHLKYLKKSSISWDGSTSLRSFLPILIGNDVVVQKLVKIFDELDFDLYVSSDCVLDGEWLPIKGNNSIGTLDNLFVRDFVGSDQEDCQNLRFKWVSTDGEPPASVVFGKNRSE
jgi:hypothetical protein